MIECVMLDTLPEKANLILNILWDRNHPMSVTELIEALKEEFSLNCEKEEVQDYLRFLLASDYAEKKRKGLRCCMRHLDRSIPYKSGRDTVEI